jgi:hypothetical protein
VRTKRTEIAAIHDPDLLELLERLGLRDQYLGSNLVCSECGKRIAPGGVGTIRSTDGATLVSCNGRVCVEAVHASR